MKKAKKIMSILIIALIVSTNIFSSLGSRVDGVKVSTNSEFEEQLEEGLELEEIEQAEKVKETEEETEEETSENDTISDGKETSDLKEEEISEKEETKEAGEKETSIEDNNTESESNLKEKDYENEKSDLTATSSNVEKINKSTISEANLFGAEGDLVYWAVREQYGSKFYLYLSMTNSSNITNKNNLDKGSFSNLSNFTSEEDVPWHEYRSNITNVSVSGTENINCVSIAYWFKDLQITSTITNRIFYGNELLKDMSHAFENSKVKSVTLYSHSDIKNMDSAFKNCKNLNHVQIGNTQKYERKYPKLDENGFRDVFSGCTNLRRINLRNFDFSEYEGEICSFNDLSKLVKITVYDSGELFNKVNLSGEWWAYDTGNKYTSSNMPKNIKVIRKYETFNNTIYWYYKDDNNDELHISSVKPTHSNYKNGHYFNGDETNTYGMLPRDVADDNIIVLDNDIVIRNDGGSNFFGNLAYGCKEIKNLEKLNTENVTDMTWMFGELNVTDLDLRTLNTKNVTSMNCMFLDCKNLQNIDLSGFNTSKVTDMTEMFYGCSNLKTLDISSFSTESLNDGEEINDSAIWDMFGDCSQLKTIYVSSKFNITCDPDFPESNEVFSGCFQLVGGNGTKYKDEYKYAEYAKIDKAGTKGLFTAKSASDVTDSGVTHILNYDWYDEDSVNLSKEKVTKIKFQVGGTISNYTEVFDIDNKGLKGYISNNTEVIIFIPSGDKIRTEKNCRLMFSFDNDYDSSLKSIENLNVLDTSNAENMSMMFYGNRVLTDLDLSSFNTNNVKTMQNMFEGCYKLQTIKGLDKFNTSKVTDMAGMFSGCNSLKNINLSNFDTYYCNDFSYMFYSCGSLVTLDLSSFDTYNEPYIEGMFENCLSLKTIYVSDKFNVGYSLDSTGMFMNCIALVGGKGTKYDSNHIDKEYARIDGGINSNTPGYFTEKSSGSSKNECVITFRPGTNGKGTMNQQIVKSGQKTKLSPNKFTRSGYIMSYWSGSDGKIYSDGGYITITKDINLQAFWTKVSSSGGGGGGDSSGSVSGIGPMSLPNNNNYNVYNQTARTTKAPTTSKNDTNTKQVLSTNAAWITDPVTGGWKLNTVNENGLPVAATNGFYALNSVVTQLVNNIPVQVPVSDIYFFDAAGNMVTGWVQTVDNKWYFFDNTPNANMGKMTTGWREVQGSYYYFTQDGTMMTNGITPDGYTIGTDGRWVR